MQMQSLDLSPQLLYTRLGLQEVDRAFLRILKAKDEALYNVYQKARTLPSLFSSSLEESAFLLELAPVVESFLADLFEIRDHVSSLQKEISGLEVLFQCRRRFVQRQVLKKFSAEESKDFEGPFLEKEILSILKKDTFDAEFFSHSVLIWLEDPERYAQNLEISEKYAAWRVWTEKESALSLEALLFHIPQKIDFQNLIPTIRGEKGERKLKGDELHLRDGFDLTDLGKNTAYACAEAHYCIFCHFQGKDSCSKGLPEKNSSEKKTFQKNSLGISLKGCPLKQKISEMNILVTQGYMIGGLAMVAIDNPLVAATGARICNDCRQSCIYQKQDAVDIPTIETEVLKSVLSLPWGFELYSLLTRWNPLNFRNPLPKASTNYKVLVVGMGPAGFTLSHYLLNQGHCVVGVDGLKIEPLPSQLIGTEKGLDFKLIKDVGDLFSSLSERLVGGFGGVMEYGITARWNKNYLLLIRLLLERRASSFSLLGSTRFGGFFNAAYARLLGFDHISLCLGAGAPRLLKKDKSLAKGIRQASDFLMTLHLGGGVRKNNFTNFVLRLPLVVLGGGLTAVDTATEAQAYYRQQVETFLWRYEILIKAHGKETVEKNWTQEDKEIAAEFRHHAARLREEEERARYEGRSPHFQKLMEEFGGVTIAYRGALEDSPAYRYNAEEVKSALSEGISFLEHVDLLSLTLDEQGWISEIIYKGQKPLKLSAKSILVAYGARANTALIRHGELSLPLEGEQLSPLEEIFFDGGQDFASVICQLPQKDEPSISFLGDLNPLFSGSVVKAMASAKEGAPFITKLLKKSQPTSQDSAKEFSTSLKDFFETKIIDIQEIAPKILEITLHAPFAAKAFRPGQFFRLQRFDTFSPKVTGTLFSMEGIALTGASACEKTKTLKLIVLEVGASTELCQFLQKGEAVSLMGPTGSPSDLPREKTVLLIGGGLGNAVLFSIGKALRENGCRVLYVAGYKSFKERFKAEEIENAADIVLWCTEDTQDKKLFSKRNQDLIFKGRVTEALYAYDKGTLGEPPIPLREIQHILTVGSAGMMEAVAWMRQNALSASFAEDHKAYGSINSPMQCMMKEICARCLQRHQDPMTGLETIVFSCVSQDQPLDDVDFSCLKARLEQDHLTEDMARQWGTFLNVFK